ncbi:hypothetical protein DXG01_006198, partial [Tephrocybe rancida]
VETDKWLEGGVHEVDADVGHPKDDVEQVQAGASGSVEGDIANEVVKHVLLTLEGTGHIGNLAWKVPVHTCLPPLLIIKASDI